MYNGTSGIFEKEFDCIADACKYLNISVDNVSHICDCCSGKQYSCAKHLWNYNKYEKLETKTKGAHLIFNKLIGYNDLEILEFYTMKEAYAYFNVKNTGKIKYCILNPSHTFKGFHWRIE